MTVMMWRGYGLHGCQAEELHVLEGEHASLQQELQASEEAVGDLRAAIASQVQHSASLAAEAAQARAQLQRQHGAHDAEARSARCAVHAQAESPAHAAPAVCCCMAWHALPMKLT